MYDLRDVVDAIAAAVKRHAIGPTGAYRRWLWQDAAGSRDLGPNPYGCADAANLLYSIGRFPSEAGERAAWIEAIGSFQNPETGLFREATHHDIHVTAHCVAALELFDARPAHPLLGLAHLRMPGGIEELLDSLDWRGNPWIESHRGAGAYAALVIAGEADGAWQDRYFGWLAAECDPETGFFRKGCMPRDGSFLFPHLAGSFHYLFNLEHARRAHPHPAAMVDSCLAIFEKDWFAPLGRSVGFAEIDWVYCLVRGVAQSGHRFDESRRALRAFTDRYVGFLRGLDFEADDGINDLHRLFGMTCALAELQRALPGELRTERPLRLVLDRRPFI